MIASGSSATRPALTAFWAVMREDKPRLVYALNDRMYRDAREAFDAAQEQRDRDGLPWAAYTCAGWVESGPEKDPRTP